MKVWIDILTPKQVMLFSRLIPELEKKGHETFLTTRSYKETNELLALKGIDAVSIGKHGGKDLANKLESSTERILELQKLAKKEKPEISISLCSPESSRVSFGLKIKSICINDIPESEAVSRLTVPLSTLLVTPKLIPKQAFVKYGISEDKILRYDALDPAAWLKDFNPNSEVLENLEIDKSKRNLVFRTEETFASYLQGKVENSVIVPLLDSLSDSFDENFIILPRYEEQKSYLLKRTDGKAVFPAKMIDSQSLLHHSDLFVGAGGTMTLEAGLLGTPTLDCRGIDTFYGDYAIEKEIVQKTRSLEEAVGKATEILNDHSYKKKQKNRAKKLLETMENPIDVILQGVERLEK